MSTVKPPDAIHRFRADEFPFPIREDVPLSSLGTFQLGGPARWVVEADDTAGLMRLRRAISSSDLPTVLIGGGSNLLFSDEGWPGLVVRYRNEVVQPERRGADRLRVSAAMPLDGLAAWAAAEGLAGLEAFSGIPGTVGGAVVGNAGAWGVQMSDVLESILAVDERGVLHELQVSDCGFAYRDSKLKDGALWVAEVLVRVTPGDGMTLRAERERILALRAEKHPDWRVTPCIGSFFRNVEPSSAAERRRAAGWFLEQAGAKSLRIGGAGVFPGHANIPIKVSAECRAADVAALAREMQRLVRERHGLDLVREVRYLGRIPGETPGASFY